MIITQQHKIKKKCLLIKINKSKIKTEGKQYYRPPYSLQKKFLHPKLFLKVIKKKIHFVPANKAGF